MNIINVEFLNLKTMIGKKVIIRADHINEEWVSINGYEGLYEVSTSGRVRSLPKKHGFLLKNLRIKNQ